MFVQTAASLGTLVVFRGLAKGAVGFQRGGCQCGNHRLPLQRTAGSERLELLVPNLGTMGYHCKQLPVTRGWNSCVPTWDP